MDMKSKEEGKEMQLACSRCDGRTFHRILKSLEYTESDGDADVYNEFQIMQCQGCRVISFRSNWTHENEFDSDGETLSPNHEELYPSRIAGRRELKDAWRLPSKVLALYKETHHALCNRQRILGGIGIRALAEALCNEKGAQGSNLEKQIDDLVRLGLLTLDGAEILHGTRLLGNVAAHEAEALPENSLDAAMDVVEHLLIGIFLLPEKAKHLPKRKPSP